MKVGTDGTLLGAWAAVPVVHLPSPTVLDIGTGTGLLALMLAQRFTEARITAIDIAPEAVAQARDNVEASPFRNIEVLQADVRTFRQETAREPGADAFTAIVCNPPYFVDALQSPDAQRTVARHAVTLSYRELMASVRRLLADDGEFSVVVPFDCKKRLESEAALAGFFLSRQCAVKTTPRKAPRRFLMAFRKHPCQQELTEGVIETAPGVRSTWYGQLTRDFYL